MTFLGKGRGGYDDDGQQWAKGPYLILFDIKSGGELRCVIVNVKLEQFGHFMMGSVDLGDHRIGLSGAYGSDGLPETAPEDLWPRLHPIPREIVAGYWKSDAGDWHEKLRDWALENEERLSELLPDPRPKPDWKFKHPYSPIEGPVHIPYVDDGYKRPLYIRQGQLVLYRAGDGIRLARVVCWAKWKPEDEAKLAVLELASDLHFSYERWCEPQAILQVVEGGSDHAKWFMTAKQFGPDVFACGQYGALSEGSIHEFLDVHGELVFPDTKWRETKRRSWTRKGAFNLDLEVQESIGDLVACMVNNKAGRDWNLLCREHETDTPETDLVPPKPEGAVFEVHYMREGLLAAQKWCETRGEELGKAENDRVCKKLREEIRDRKKQE